MRVSLLVVFLVMLLVSFFAAQVPVVTTVVPVYLSLLTPLLAPLPPFRALFTGRLFGVLLARHHLQLPSLCPPR